MRVALSAKYVEDKLLVVDKLGFNAEIDEDVGKARKFREVLEAFQLDQKQRLLMVTGSVKEEEEGLLRRACSNFPLVQFVHTSELNIVQLVQCDRLALDMEALRVIEEKLVVI